MTGRLTTSAVFAGSLCLAIAAATDGRVEPGGQRGGETAARQSTIDLLRKLGATP